MKIKERLFRKRDEGISVKQLSIEYEVNIDTIKRMIRKYRVHGPDSLVKTSKRVFPLERKYEVLCRYQKGESLNSLSIEYDIENVTILSWLKRYEKDGYNGLIDKKKGRPPKIKKDDDVINEAVHKDSNKTKTESTDKAKIKLLEKKNKELETEVAYLKKLNALVQERKKRESRKK